MDDNPFAPTDAPVGASASSGPMYTLAQIGTMTLLATPLGGAWLIGLNERRLGRGFWTPILLGATALVLLFGISAILPENFPSIAVQLASVFGVRAWAEHVQGKDLSAHWLAGGAARSWAVVVGLGLAIGVGLAGVVVGLILAADGLEP